MRWIVLSFVAGCVLASVTGCNVGNRELIYTSRVEHTEFWHNVNMSNSKAMLELKYQYKF